MHLHEHSRFREELGMLFMWTTTIATWLAVLGFALFGLVVLLWRELQRIG